MKKLITKMHKFHSTTINTTTWPQRAPWWSSELNTNREREKRMKEITGSISVQLDRSWCASASRAHTHTQAVDTPEEVAALSPMPETECKSTHNGVDRAADGQTRSNVPFCSRRERENRCPAPTSGVCKGPQDGPGGPRGANSFATIRDIRESPAADDPGPGCLVSRSIKL